MEQQGGAVSIHVVGISHKTAPLKVRERCAIGPEDVPRYLAKIREQIPDAEVCLLSTCNRTELYLGLDSSYDPSTSQGKLRRLFTNLSPQAIASDDSALYVLSGALAVSHIFKVAGSLDSMIVGETQITGQFRSAAHKAREAGLIGGQLSPVLEGAQLTARRIHTETALGEGQVSVPSVAVQFVLKVFQSLDDKSTLIVGSGETARLVVTHLREQGMLRFAVANRSFDRAFELAEEFAGTAVPWERLDDVLGRYDIVVCTTGSPKPVLSAPMISRAIRHRHGRPIVFLDLAVPRDIDEKAADLVGAFLFNLDDLKGIADENLSRRKSEVRQATAIVASEAEKLVQREQLTQKLGPVVSAVRGSAEAMARAETSRLFGKLGDLDKSERREIEQMAARLVNKLLHHPLATIKKEAHNGAFRESLAMFEKLFGVAASPSPHSPAGPTATPRRLSGQAHHANYDEPVTAPPNPTP